MSLRFKFDRARQIVASLNADDRGVLEGICGDIRKAQVALASDAADLMDQCATACGGLCCRNVYPDELISLIDAIFITASAGAPVHQILDSAERESLFSADCVFLRDGVGPCVFSADTKPAKCIATFCGDIRPARPAIRRMRAHFRRLYWYLLRKQPIRMLGF